MGNLSEMLGGLISYALLAGLATALLVAAATDLRRREIDNWLTAGIALAAPLYWISAGLGWVDVAFQLGLAAVTFAAACALFAMRQMGGGDVKLLSALALWFVPGSFGQLIVLMGMIGGGASVAMGVYNMRRLPGEALRDSVSIVVASVWVLGACSLVYGAATGRALMDSESVRSISTGLPQGWLLALLAVALAFIFAVGMGHMFRRQRGQIAVPYGVAISAAALWVLGQNLASTGMPSAV